MMMTQTRRRNITYRVFTSTAGPSPWPCDYCGEPVIEIKMGIGCIHHRDDDKTNDAPANLGAMHTACHVRHHRKGKPGNRKGIRWSPEMKAHFSRMNRGKPAAHGYTPEIMAKIAAANRGRPHIEPQYTCECGKICNAGPMKLHQRAFGHKMQVNPLDRYDETTGDET